MSDSLVKNSTTATRNAPAPQEWPPSGRVDFWALTCAIAMVGLAMGTVLPLSAAKLSAWGLGSAQIGAAIAAYAFGSILSMPLGEWAVSRLGARGALRAFAMLGAGWCCALEWATGPVALALGLLGLGALLGGAFNIVEAWVNMTIPEARRGSWVAIHCTVFTCLQLAGPILLAAMGQNGAFAWCSALIALGFPSLFALGNATFAEGEAASDAAPWWTILGQRPGIAASVCLFAIFDAVVLGLLPLYAELGGLSADLCLMSASVALAGDTLLEWAVGAMSDAIGCRRSQWICALALFAMAPAMPFVLGTAAWWPLLFLIGGAAGGLYVLAMVECGQAYTGARLLKATALLGSVWGGASIAGPLGAGALMASIGSWSIPLLLAGLALLLMAAMAAERFAFTIKTTTRKPENEHANNNA